MKDKIKLRLTVQLDYFADKKYYPDSDFPEEEWAQIDYNNYTDDPSGLIDLLDSSINDLVITVEAVKEG